MEKALDKLCEFVVVEFVFKIGAEIKFNIVAFPVEMVDFVTGGLIGMHITFKLSRILMQNIDNYCSLELKLFYDCMFYVEILSIFKVT